MPVEEGVGTKALLEFLVKHLVDHPDEVQVHESRQGQETVLELTVDGSDMGRIIGKGGRVINAVRALVQVAAAKEGTTVSVELIEH